MVLIKCGVVERRVVERDVEWSGVGGLEWTVFG